MTSQPTATLTQQQRVGLLLLVARADPSTKCTAGRVRFVTTTGVVVVVVR